LAADVDETSVVCDELIVEKAESEGLHMSDVLARELMDHGENGAEDTDIIDFFHLFNELRINFHPLAADVDETSVVCDELIEFILCHG
jgi:hypothetical protein